MNGKRCHRLVTLPDYQGLGIGTRLLEWVAERYRQSGYRYYIRTSQAQAIHALEKSGRWRCTGKGKAAANGNMTTLNRTVSSSRYAAGFEYLGLVKEQTNETTTETPSTQTAASDVSNVSTAVNVQDAMQVSKSVA